MQAMLGACVLWALISTAASLTCNRCISVLGPCLHSQPEFCAPGKDVCFDLLGMVTILGTFSGNFKGCISSKYCQPGNFSITTKLNQGVQALSTCCNTDYCNKAIHSMPEIRNKIPNGLECPGCYSFMADDCLPEEMVPCTGEETQCLLLTGAFDLGGTRLPLKLNGVVKGCATLNFCTFPERSSEETGFKGVTYSITRKECWNATNAVTTVTNGTLPNGTLQTLLAW